MAINELTAAGDDLESCYAGLVLTGVHLWVLLTRIFGSFWLLSASFCLGLAWLAYQARRGGNWHCGFWILMMIVTCTLVETQKTQQTK